MEVEDDPDHFRCGRSCFSDGLSAAGGCGLRRSSLVRGARDGQRRVLGLPISVVRSMSAECGGGQSWMVQPKPVLCFEWPNIAPILSKTSRARAAGHSGPLIQQKRTNTDDASVNLQNDTRVSNALIAIEQIHLLGRDFPSALDPAESVASPAGKRADFVVPEFANREIRTHHTLVRCWAIEHFNIAD